MVDAGGSGESRSRQARKCEAGLDAESGGENLALHYLYVGIDGGPKGVGVTHRAEQPCELVQKRRMRLVREG